MRKSGYNFMRIRRLLSIILTLALVAILIVPASPVEATVEPSGYWTDEGIVSAPPEPTVEYGDGYPQILTYKIRNASELAWFAIENRYYTSNIRYVIELENDIDMSGHFWVPIGNETWSFKGTFDGKGYTISNMTIGTASFPSTLGKVGLFGYARESTIKNVNMTNVSIYANFGSGVLSAGGLVGMGHGCEISGVTVAGGISASSTAGYSGVGGIVGSSTSNLNNCTSSVIITALGSGGMPAGGLVGASTGGIIESCSATGSVEGLQCVGGLIGYAEGNGSVINSYATANVIGGDDSVAGGLIGDSNFNVESCFALGDVKGYNVGGLIGLGRTGTIKNSFAIGNISASGPAGGLIGMSVYSGLSAISNCYASGNIETTQTNVNNQHVGGLVGYFNTVVGTAITNAYWNSDARQIVADKERTPEEKMGIDSDTDDSTTKSQSEMSDVTFAELLNTNRDGSRQWQSVYGINGGYPYLEGLNFTTPATYEVKFISDDVVYKTMNVEQGGTVDAPKPTKDRYDFMGWYTTSDDSGDVFDYNGAITADTSIYAKWAPKPTYSVTYNANGGEGAPEDSAKYIEGDTVTLASGAGLSKSNAVFEGWTLSSDGSGTVYKFNSTYPMKVGGVTFYAKWTSLYTVSYNLNGGTGTAPVDSNFYKLYDLVYVKSGDGLSKENCIFVGWTLSSTGTGTVYNATSTYPMSVGSVTFHAKWVSLYTVSYDLNGGQGPMPEDESRYEGEWVLLPFGDELTNGDLAFGGWVDAKGRVYNPKYEDYIMGSSDVTFYARWTNYWTDFVDIDADAPDWDEESNTFTIDSASELAWVACMVNSGLYNFEGVEIVIGDSVSAIDLSAHEWVPIGSYDEYFSGEFDGNYKKIINLKIGTVEAPDTELMEVGLFGSVVGAKISNVYLSDVEIYSSYGRANIGSLAGYAYDSIITNNCATGIISSNGEENDIGGLLGYSDYNMILDCHARVDIIGSKNSYVGGFLGLSEYSQLSESYATGKVTGGDGAAAGGLIGSDSNGIIKNNYATGDVRGSGVVLLGGFIGVESGSDISFGYWNSDAIHTINGTNINDGINLGKDTTTSKTAAEMKSDDFAQLLNVNRSDEMSSTWTIISDVNDSYPVLANTVSFDKNGGNTEAIPASKIIALGDKVGIFPTAPERSGYSFSGWYTEQQCINQFNIVTPITDNITLYAKWIQNTPPSGGDGTYLSPQYSVTDMSQGVQIGGQVSLNRQSAAAGDTIIITVTLNSGYENGTPIVFDKSGNPLTVIDKGDGSYGFKMPHGKVTVEVEFTKTNYFNDVSKDDWFGEAAWFCAANGLMEGTGNRQFEGDTVTDRAMLVTVLYRLANSSESLENIFTDVEDGKWYSEAIAWAAHNNIVEGYGNGKFSPTDMLTRQQMVTILYRYAEFMKYDLSKHDELQGFSDADNISDWAFSGMQWAVGNGILEGMGEGIISPNSGVTRAQFAVMMQRFCTIFVK